MADFQASHNGLPFPHYFVYRLRPLTSGLIYNIMPVKQRKNKNKEVYAPRDVKIPARLYDQFEMEWREIAIRFVNGEI